MNYRRANADELVLDDRNRYHKLCEELDYVMSLDSSPMSIRTFTRQATHYAGRLGHPAITPSAFTNVTTN